jgi:cyclic lactone autoinducer peptide
MKKFLLGLILSLLTVFAISSMCGACGILWYQPELPQR